MSLQSPEKSSFERPAAHIATAADPEKGNEAAESKKAGTNSPLQDSSSEDLSDANKGVEEPPRPVRGVLWALVVVSILSSTFLFSLDNTIVVSETTLGTTREDQLLKRNTGCCATPNCSTFQLS